MKITVVQKLSDPNIKKIRTSLQYWFAFNAAANIHFEIIISEYTTNYFIANINNID